MLDVFRTCDEKLGSVNRIVCGNQPYYRLLTRTGTLATIRETIISLTSRNAAPEPSP